MAREMNSIDDFLNHRTSDRSGGFLKDWKKNTPPKIDVVLHKKRMPIAIWQHPGPPRIVVREVDGQSKSDIWGGNWNCLETEEELRRQYHRHDDGSRKHYPKKCPLCRLIEVVREMIAEEQLNWLQPIFRFESDQDKRIIHAGGLCGMFKDDDLDEADKEEMRAAGIVMKDARGGGAWTENSYAKCLFIFCVVDVGNVEAGIQITTQPGLLGDKVKDCMNDAIESLGAEDGNPFLKPYAIQWEHRPKEPEFNKKYKARRMEKIPITPAIEAAINSPPPDLSQLTAPFNIKTMRAYLERHALVKLPWDHIFEVPIPEDQNHAEMPANEAKGKLPPAAGASAAKESPPADDLCPKCKKTEADGCPHVACDDCDEPILETDAKCDNCGKVYREEPPPPPAKGRGGRKRSEVKESGNKPPFA